MEVVLRCLYMIIDARFAGIVLNCCAPFPSVIRLYAKSAAQRWNASIRASALSVQRRAAAEGTAPAVPAVVGDKNRSSLKMKGAGAKAGCV